MLRIAAHAFGFPEPDPVCPILDPGEQKAGQMASKMARNDGPNGPQTGRPSSPHKWPAQACSISGVRDAQDCGTRIQFPEPDPVCPILVSGEQKSKMALMSVMIG